jgi:hypothetical protein
LTLHCQFRVSIGFSFALQLVSLLIRSALLWQLRLISWLQHRFLLTSAIALHLVQLPQVVLQQLVLVLFTLASAIAFFGGSISSNFSQSIFFERFGLSSILNLVCASASAVAFASAVFSLAAFSSFSLNFI